MSRFTLGRENIIMVFKKRNGVASKSRHSPKEEKSEKRGPSKTDRYAGSGRPQRSERVERAYKSEKPQRAERSYQLERAERSEAPRFDKSVGNERPQRSEKKDYAAPIRSKKGLPREIFIWGRRTVEAFLANLHQSGDTDNTKYALHIIVDKSHKAPSQLKPSVESAQLLGIKVVPHDSAEETWPLADASEELNHQRVCLKIPEYPTQNIVEAINFVKSANENAEHRCVGIVLDQVQDPRNFGAIIRSAAFFGLKFVIYGTDRQADISSLVLKTSAGGAFSVSLIPTVNINRALQQLKEAGCWVAGAAIAENAVSLKELPKDRTWVAVLGNEGKGLRNEILKNCDYIVKIPGGQGAVDSLNVSVAAGVLFHSLAK
jgi:23S rRNA (guanosine2251-2'-O)-methyltransferase